MTYLWGHLLSAPVAVPEEVVPDSTGRTWNLANRLMIQTFSNSSHSNPTSKIDVALSNLHCQMKVQWNVNHMASFKHLWHSHALICTTQVQMN